MAAPPKQTKAEDVLNFQLGQGGLNLTGMPLNMQPGDLLTAKNVEYVRDQGLGGLGSRGSLTPLNTESLGGPIMAFAAVPLASAVDNATIDALFFSSPDGMLRSLDGGATWVPFDFSLIPDLVLLPWNPSLLVALDDEPDPPLAYYPKDNGDGTTSIVAIDLTTLTPEVVATVDDAVAAMVALDGRLWIGINSTKVFELDGSADQVSPVIASRVEIYTPGHPTTVPVGKAFGGYNVEDDGTPRDVLGATQTNPNYAADYQFGGYTGNGSAIASMKVTNNRVYVHVGALVSNNAAFDDNFVCGLGAPLPLPRPHRSGSRATSVYSIGIGETDWTLEGADSAVGYQGAPGGIAALFGTGVYGGASGTDASGELYFDAAAQDDCSPVPNTDGTGKGPDPATIGRVALSRWDATPGGFTGVGKTLLVDDLNDGYAYFGPGIVFDGKLFVAYVSAPSLGAGATAIRIYRLDADDAVNFPSPDWVIDKEIVGSFGGSVNPGVPYIVDTALYWPFASTAPSSGYICKRTTAAVWSKPTTGLDLVGPGIKVKVPF